MWSFYASLLKKYPLMTQMTSSAVIWGYGDVSAQFLERKQKVEVENGLEVAATSAAGEGQNLDVDQRISTQIDWKRTSKQATYAALLWGPLGHCWYAALDRAVAPLAAVGTRKNLLLKMCGECGIMHPLSLLMFFTVMGAANHESWTRIRQQLKTDFLPTLVFEWLLWAPLDLSVLWFVPVRHQLMAINAGCFVESTALSWIKQNGISFEQARPGLSSG